MSAISGFNTAGTGLNTGAHSSPLHLCPKCNAYTDSRIPNGKLADKLLFWMPLRQYQCTSCDHRFYILAR